jgi:hypothetical protein
VSGSQLVARSSWDKHMLSLDKVVDRRAQQVLVVLTEPSLEQGFPVWL